MTHAPHSGTEQAWAAVGGDPALLPRIEYGGPAGLLPSRLPVMELARSTVAVCTLAAAERAGSPRVRVDDGAVATAFTSERHLLVDGRAPVNFAPLSRFWRTADGWVRTHANYPHHKAALLAALGVREEKVESELAGRRSLEVEETVYAAVAERPLVVQELLDEAPPKPRGGRLKVLDLTRVIAGPVATRTLGLLGADVLRIDAPWMPELPDQHADTGFGKRSATLDLRRHADRRTFGELLDAADVLVTGYRPGALDVYDLRRPGLVIAQLSAWGDHGPWRERRGFDSLVQVATGIALLEGTEGAEGRPGALPAQALDHGTGYLLAAAVLRALTEQDAHGGTRRLRLSLARTAHWLRGMAPGPGVPADAYIPRLTETDSPLGRLQYAPTPVAYEGGPADWSRPPGPWGSDSPQWLTA
ncbi:CoA transferase [Streptomyces sp. NPDC050738]|uniref:CoA transferase n=1 Tax=Streptomyces sp. NPDC050738 TaxID=3154744 RepID=UPI00343FD166